VGVLRLEVFKEELLELANLAGLDLVQEAAHASVQDANLLLSGHRDVLLLLEQLSQLLSSVQEVLGRGVEVGAELGEGSDFSVLGELELEGTGDLLHGLDLGGGADTGHRETDVDGGTDTLVEELSLEEDLAVGDGDHIGGDIGGYITSLGLDDGESGQGAATVGVAHLGCALEQARVQIEDVTGVGLTTGGSSQKEGHLSVGDGLLGKIVVDDEAVLAGVSEELTDGAAGVRSEELQGSSLGRGGRNHNGVLEGVVVTEHLHDVRDGGSLLADGNVDAVELLAILGVAVGEGSLLVQDGVDGDGSLAGLSVANDQLSLASANGNLCKYFLIKDSSGAYLLLLYRKSAAVFEILTRESTDLRPVCMGSCTDFLGMMPGALSSTLWRWSERMGPWPSMALPRASTTLPSMPSPMGTSTMEPVLFTMSPSWISLHRDQVEAHLPVVAEDDNTNVISFQVEGHTLDAGVELDHLTSLDLGKTEDSCDTITDRNNGTELLEVVLLY